MLLPFLFLCCCSAAFGLCPPEEGIAPLCYCREVGGDSMMVCDKVMSPDELVAPIRSVVLSQSKMYAITFRNSSLNYIPQDLFKQTTFEKIRFLNSEVMSLSDTDVAFVGLENTLDELRATGAHFVAQWDWQQLRNLKNLHLIDVNWITMDSVPEPFPELPELYALGIIKAEINDIHENAFQNLRKLSILNMKQNSIAELKRSMLPDPADNLSILDFSENLLSSLPADFFINMPSLTSLHLDDNHFITLAENPFGALFSKIQEVTMKGNKIRCDCRLRWIVGHRVPHSFNAICSSPESLSGVAVKHVDLKSLWC